MLWNRIENCFYSRCYLLGFSQMYVHTFFYKMARAFIKNISSYQGSSRSCYRVCDNFFSISFFFKKRKASDIAPSCFFLQVNECESIYWNWRC